MLHYPIGYPTSFSFQAFYLPNKERPNYKVLINAHAHRIVTERAANGNLQAIGVEFEVGGKLHTVNARKDVVLAAGYISFYFLR